LTLSITDGDGADNQVSPDVIGPTNPAVGEAVLDYANQPGGGYRVGTCLPYRAVNLPFGLEGVSEQADRVAIIENTLDWFQSGPVLEGIKAAPESETKVGSAGTQIIHTFYLQNLAETGPDDTFSVSLGSHNWDTTLSESNITLASCQTALVTITVTVPPNVTWQDQDVLPITVGSSLHPGLSAVITRTSKAPATVLLVDDDRWYNFEDQYMAALNAAATPFDRWDVLGSGIEQSPPLATLRLYPMVIWYTGYDWYNPLTTAEEATLKAYLDGGGRLILSSQEYLYNLPDQKPSDFSRDYLGIQTYTEAYSSTRAVGVAGNPLGNQSGPSVLNFPAA
jgi:hypothetical protein